MKLRYRWLAGIALMALFAVVAIGTFSTIEVVESDTEVSVASIDAADVSIESGVTTVAIDASAMTDALAVNQADGSEVPIDQFRNPLTFDVAHADSTDAAPLTIQRLDRDGSPPDSLTALTTGTDAILTARGDGGIL